MSLTFSKTHAKLNSPEKLALYCKIMLTQQYICLIIEHVLVPASTQIGNQQANVQGLTAMTLPH
jgi:hypothetical protein